MRYTYVLVKLILNGKSARMCAPIVDANMELDCWLYVVSKSKLMLANGSCMKFKRTLVGTFSCFVCIGWILCEDRMSRSYRTLATM